MVRPGLGSFIILPAWSGKVILICSLVINSVLSSLIGLPSVVMNIPAVSLLIHK